MPDASVVTMCRPQTDVRSKQDCAPIAALHNDAGGARVGSLASHGIGTNSPNIGPLSTRAPFNASCTSRVSSPLSGKDACCAATHLLLESKVAVYLESTVVLTSISASYQLDQCPVVTDQSRGNDAPNALRLLSKLSCSRACSTPPAAISTGHLPQQLSFLHPALSSPQRYFVPGSPGLFV